MGVHSWHVGCVGVWVCVRSRACFQRLFKPESTSVAGWASCRGGCSVREHRIFVCGTLTQAIDCLLLTQVCLPHTFANIRTWTCDPAQADSDIEPTRYSRLVRSVGIYSPLWPHASSSEVSIIWLLQLTLFTCCIVVVWGLTSLDCPSSLSRLLLVGWDVSFYSCRLALT